MSKRKLQDIGNLPKADSTNQIEKVKKSTKATKAESTEEKFVELNACLRKASNSGEISFEGEAPELPCMLGLEIKDFGVVSLPFQDPQASELIKRCEQAPFGKNSKTLVDKAVRDSYQLDPSQFKINNPDWNKKLDEVVSRVEQGLGCEAKIEAKIYKLLVYKQGGHFLKHQDTEKEKRMFGTLVIQLPSLHTGGELVVYDSTKRFKKVIDFGQKTGKNQHMIHFAAHYADLEHELLEVKSGYRIALVYSLCWVHGNAVNNIIANAKLTDELVEIFKSLNNNEYHLGILLEHQYTPQSLSQNGVRALKGVDNARFSMLSQANLLLPVDKQLTFYICHASLNIDSYDVGGGGYSKKNRYWQDDPDNYEWEENQREYEFADWYDINGRKACTDTSKMDLTFFTKVFDPSVEGDGEIDLEDEDSWGKHVKMDFEGFTGNESATKEVEYSKYILVMLPKRSQFYTMLMLDLMGSIDSFYSTIVGENRSIHPKMRSEFGIVLQYLATHKSQSHHLDAQCFARIFHLIRLFNKVDHLKLILNEVKIALNDEGVSNLGLAISHFGFETMLDGFFKPTLGNFIEICRFIQIIHDANQIDLSVKMMNNYILPFLCNIKQCEEIVKLAFRSTHAASDVRFKFETGSNNNLLNLVKFLVKFPEQSSMLYEMIKTSMIKLMNEASDFGSFVEVLVKEKQAFKSCRPIVEILEQRRQWLEKKLRERPQFSWKMPNAEMPNHPKIEQFLWSDQQSLVYGNLNDHSHLRNFIRKYSNSYSWGDGGYSVEMKEQPGLKVHIKKTRHWFDQKDKEFVSYSSEFERIKDFLDSK